MVVEPTSLKNMLLKSDHFLRARGRNKTCLKPPSSEIMAFPFGVFSGEPESFQGGAAPFFAPSYALVEVDKLQLLAPPFQAPVKLLGGSSHDGRKWLITINHVDRCCPLRIARWSSYFLWSGKHPP